MSQRLPQPEGRSFQSIAERYRDELAREGITVRATAVAGQSPLFGALSPPDQERVLAQMERDLAILAEIRRLGKAQDSPRYLWSFLKRCGFTPCTDIFDKITNEDVVIVFDTQNRQLFQNLKFFEFVSFTLEQLFCAPWYEYSSRPPEVEKGLYAAAVSLLTGQVKNTICPNVPAHVFQEVNTEGLLKVNIDVRWGSPIFVDGQPAGMIVVQRCSAVK